MDHPDLHHGRLHVERHHETLVETSGDFFLEKFDEGFRAYSRGVDDLAFNERKRLFQHDGGTGSRVKRDFDGPGSRHDVRQLAAEKITAVHMTDTGTARGGREEGGE